MRRQRIGNPGAFRVHRRLHQRRGQGLIQRAQPGQKCITIFRHFQQLGRQHARIVVQRMIYQPGNGIIPGRKKRIGKIARGALPGPFLQLIKEDFAVEIRHAQIGVHRHPVQEALRVQQPVQRLQVLRAGQIQPLDAMKSFRQPGRIAADCLPVRPGHVQPGRVFQPLKPGDCVLNHFAPGIQAPVFAIEIHGHRLLRGHGHRNGPLSNQIAAYRADDFRIQRVVAIVIEDEALIVAINAQALLRQGAFHHVQSFAVQPQPRGKAGFRAGGYQRDLRVHRICLGKHRIGGIGDADYRQRFLLCQPGQRAQAEQATEERQ